MAAHPAHFPLTAREVEAFRGQGQAGSGTGAGGAAHRDLLCQPGWGGASSPRRVWQGQLGLCQVPWSRWRSPGHVLLQDVSRWAALVTAGS